MGEEHSASGWAHLEPADAVGGPVAEDHPPPDVGKGDRAEAARVSAGLWCVPTQLDRRCAFVYRGDALDELPRRVARIRGQHDLTDTRRAAGIGPALDHEPLPAEERRGHRAALHLDDVEPTSHERGGG